MPHQMTQKEHQQWRDAEKLMRLIKKALKAQGIKSKQDAHCLDVKWQGARVTIIVADVKDHS